MTSPRGKKRARLKAAQRRNAATVGEQETLTPADEQPSAPPPEVPKKTTTKAKKKKTLKSLLGND